jgi:eukaryotic-like serine/threonine-protein kinase
MSLLPERLGPYLIRSRLGAGGMGEVFLAWHEPLDRLVALKLIRQERAGDPAWRERLLAEARAAAKLAHPSVVGIHDVFETENGPCVVMEFVPGRTIARMLRDEGRLGLAEALALARDVAEGLDAAHRRGLVHRDLKSDNVMVRPGGRAVILDFGLARAPDPAGSAGAVLAGTPHTLAPEQILGRADARSDLFALGVLLYEMLAGISPFRGAGPAESLQRIRELDPQPLEIGRPGLPAGLAELTHRLLAKDPAARPQSAQEVSAALAGIAAGAAAAADEGGDDATASLLRPLPPSATATPATAPPVAASPAAAAPAAGRRRWRAALIALPLLLLALGAGAFLWPEPPIRRVLVLAPRVAAEVPDGQLLASALLSAGLAEIGSLKGLAAVDPSLLEGQGGNPAEAARAVAADEALLAEITAEATGNIQVGLRRIDRSGRALYSGSLEVPRKPVDLRWAAEAYGVALHAAFGEPAEGSGAPRLEIESADYAAFVAILSATLEDGFATTGRLAELEALAQRAPSFLPLQQMLGQMALRRFGESREPADLELGLATARRCLALAPENPQVLKLGFEAELAAGRGEEAASLLRRLEQLGGRGVLALHGRARLADREGRPAEALELTRRLVELEPSWQNLYQLAGREAGLGQVAAARGHLGEVLAIAPGNQRAKAKLAELELLYGEVAAAEKLFAELIAEKPRRSFLTNRGLALFLLGRLDEAADSFRRALAIAPGHPAAALNLADLLAARGERQEAEALYREVRGRLEAQRAKAPLSPADTMILAQCLAHLGDHLAAVALAMGVHLDAPENAELAYQATIVYAAAGERNAALVAAGKALAGGVQPRWFALPLFGELGGDPELAGLLSR